MFFHSSSVFFSTNNQLLIILADHPFTTLSVNHLKLFLLPRLNDWVGISTGDSGTPSLVCRYFDHFHVIVSSDQADVNFVAQGREDYRHGHGFNAWYYGLSDEIEGVCPTIDQGRFFFQSFQDINSNQKNSCLIWFEVTLKNINLVCPRDKIAILFSFINLPQSSDGRGVHNPAR